MVRIAVESDLDGVLALYRELRPADPELDEARRRAAWRRILDDHNLSIVVAQVRQTLVSTCMLAVIPNLASGARPFGVIEHVVTLESFRGQGWAGRVLKYALNAAWAKDCYKVILLSGAQRTQAHRLYESVGFRGDIERGFVAKSGEGGTHA